MINEQIFLPFYEEFCHILTNSSGPEMLDTIQTSKQRQEDYEYEIYNLPNREMWKLLYVRQQKTMSDRPRTSGEIY
jgi:hypothetical protein